MHDAVEANVHAYSLKTYAQAVIQGGPVAFSI